VHPDRAKILIVDDDVITQRLVRNMLKSLGHEVITARDGAEAVSLARDEKPAVILMDVLMPGMDGYTALGEIKRDLKTSKIPVVMLTGIDFNLNKKLAAKLGSSGYLIKPFTRKDLLETVTRFVPAGEGKSAHTGSKAH
jgi:two-component system alkaline phosphatase synthesis response regulator PhoP